MNIPQYKINDQLVAKDENGELYVGLVTRITAEKQGDEAYTYSYEIDGSTFDEQAIVAHNIKDQWYEKNTKAEYLSAEDLV